MISVNLNEIVKVKFTDYGKDIYYHRFDDLNERVKQRGLSVSKYLTPSYPKVDEDGYSEIQLWHFMHIFGPHMHIGMPDAVTEGNCIYLDETGRDFTEGNTTRVDMPLSPLLDKSRR